jgi:hypothetical protein
MSTDTFLSGWSEQDPGPVYDGAYINRWGDVKGPEIFRVQ